MFILCVTWVGPSHNPLYVVCVLSRFSHVQLFATLWTVAHQAPCLWDSPGKNTGVGCHALLQGIFLIQGSNPHFLRLQRWQMGSFLLVPPGKPFVRGRNMINTCEMNNHLFIMLRS